MMRKWIKASDGGYSLIEILISTVVLSIAMVAVYSGLADAVSKNFEARDLQKATFEAESVLETLQAEGIEYDADTDALEEKVKSRFSDAADLGVLVQVNEENTVIYDAETNSISGSYVVSVTKPKDSEHPLYHLVTLVPAQLPEEGAGS